jgi:hypothetical protein
LVVGKTELVNEILQHFEQISNTFAQARKELVETIRTWTHH